MLRENWNDVGAGFHPVSAPDYLPTVQLRELQLRRLKAIVARAYDNVALFRSRMDERGLTPASIEKLATPVIASCGRTCQRRIRSPKIAQDRAANRNSRSPIQRAPPRASNRLPKPLTAAS